ncbi:hypothetical protein OAI07_00350 [Akkermansiaceae bacterium]|nr:hypothetical protein [Akkermansiaceae bacterium]
MIKLLLLLMLCSGSMLYGQSGFHEALLKQVNQMPRGGGYSVKKVAFDGISKAVTIDEQGLTVLTERATPSFCSSATYLVFMKTVMEYRAKGLLKLSEAEQRALCFKDEPDGEGFWGKWNSNGPGVAKLIKDLRLGRNFESYDSARAGDFMKIFWTNDIGLKERGHLVVYLGQRVDAQGEAMVSFWSSNQPDGYGVKEVPKDTIKWVIFSRVEKIKNLGKVDNLPHEDVFLKSMLTKEFTRGEVRKACAVAPL